jgi:hypothetical protein
VKTTIDLPDALYREAKIRAVQRKTTLKELIVASLQRELEVPNPVPVEPYYARRQLLPEFQALRAAGGLRGGTDSTQAISEVVMPPDDDSLLRRLHLFKLHWAEHGSDEVQRHAATSEGLACCLHGRAEFAAAGHRKVREGVATSDELRVVFDQLRADTDAGGIRWLPLTPDMVGRTEEIFRRAPPTIVLRSADALHLACAALNGFREILQRPPPACGGRLFGLHGVDLIRRREANRWFARRPSWPVTSLAWRS